MPTELASPSPTLLNLLLCDASYREAISGKWFLMGLFNSVNAKVLPTTHGQFVVYLAIVGAKGQLPLRLQIVPADRKDEPIVKVEAELRVGNPRVVADLVLPVRNITLTKPGEHLLQVFLDNKFLGERSMTVQLVGSEATGSA